MVCGGAPSSQRKRFGAANQTWPVAVSGCVNDFSVRVWMTSADQVWMLVCELSHAVRIGQVPEAQLDSGAVASRNRAATKTGKVKRMNRPPARSERSGTIGRDVGGWRVRKHA